MGMKRRRLHRWERVTPFQREPAQRELIDTSAPADTIHRHDSPDTSVEAAKEMIASGSRHAMMVRAYDYAKRNPGSTATPQTPPDCVR